METLNDRVVLARFSSLLQHLMGATGMEEVETEGTVLSLLPPSDGVEVDFLNGMEGTVNCENMVEYIIESVRKSFGNQIEGK